MRLVLDTTVLIDTLRGCPVADRVRSLAETESPPWVCAVTIEEIWRGARPSEEDEILRLMTGLRIAPLGAAEGRRAGIWRRDFAARGVTLSQSDCLIAAAALGVEAAIATGDPGGFPMQDVKVEHWAVGA